MRRMVLGLGLVAGLVGSASLSPEMGAAYPGLGAASGMVVRGASKEGALLWSSKGSESSSSSSLMSLDMRLLPSAPMPESRGFFSSM